METISITPLVLAGREKMLSSANACLEHLRAGFPQQPVLYYGLRGSGKTAVLTAIEFVADNKNILHRHIEGGTDKSFTTQLVYVLFYFIKALDGKTTEETIRKCCSLLENFKGMYAPDDRHTKDGVGSNFDTLEITGVYSEDLCEIFVALGTAAKQAGQAMCIFLDEIQQLSREELHGLLSSLHRCIQLRLPITMFCAGLPESRQKVGDACSYAERLFRFEEILPLLEKAAEPVSGRPLTLPLYDPKKRDLPKRGDYLGAADWLRAVRACLGESAVFALDEALMCQDLFLGRDEEYIVWLYGGEELSRFNGVVVLGNQISAYNVKEKYGLFYTDFNRTISDAIANEEILDMQGITEAISHYYYENNESFDGISVAPQYQERFESLAADARECYQS
jgi:hypothetical protein